MKSGTKKLIHGLRGLQHHGPQTRAARAEKLKYHKKRFGSPWLRSFVKKGASAGEKL